MKTGESLIKDYLEELASRAPSPGGGAAAGISAALAAALAGKVAALSQGARFVAVAEPMSRLEVELLVRRERFIALADLDTQAFRDLVKAQQLARESPGMCEEIMAPALRAACQAPLALGLEIIALEPCFSLLLEHGNRNLLSDTSIAMAMAEAALFAVCLNLLINLPRIQDQVFTSRLQDHLVEFAVARERLRAWASQIQNQLEGERSK